MSTDPSAMPSFVKLLVADRARSSQFYEALGFERVHADAVFVHLRWATHADVFLVSTPPGHRLEGRRGVGVLLCFTTPVAGVDAVAERARAQGAAVDGPTDQPWFTREVVVTDPDGYRLDFVEPRGAAAPAAPTAASA